MTRTEEREQAFVLIFEKAFNMEASMDDIVSFAYEVELFEESVFAVSLAKAAYENLPAIDEIIENYAVGWKLNRIPKVTLSILRLALCEILFIDSIPEGVSINEAVELAKKYATPEDASFINGILGSYSRSKAQ